MRFGLLAAHVTLSTSFDSRLPFFVADASVTRTSAIVGGTTTGCTTVNEPVLVDTLPCESVAVIAYVWLPAVHVPIWQE